MRFNYTPEELAELEKYDRMIDKGEKVPFDLTPEQEKIAKSYTITGTRDTKKSDKSQKTERKRKENPTKGSIIAEIAKFLVEMSENACENVEIVNKERIIAFTIGENSFELTLTQKRKPKK